MSLFVWKEYLALVLGGKVTHYFFSTFIQHISNSHSKRIVSSATHAMSNVTMSQEERKKDAKRTDAFRLPPLLVKQSSFLQELLDDDSDSDGSCVDVIMRLFEYDPNNINRALEYVVNGHLEPSIIPLVSKLLLSPSTQKARDKMLLMPKEVVCNEDLLLRRVIHQELLLRPPDDPYRVRLWTECQKRKNCRALLLWKTESDVRKYTTCAGT